MQRAESNLQTHLHSHTPNPFTEDPLWELVSREVIHLMGSEGRHIQNCKPGQLSHKDKGINLYCQTKEAVQFAQQFDFIILSSLRKYFPALKEVRVKKKIF